MYLNIPKPTNTLAEVLYGLITRPEISEREYQFNGFRTRLSDLRLKYSLDVRHREVKAKNKFGRDMVYRVHYLWTIDVPQAIRVYEKINTDAKVHG